MDGQIAFRSHCRPQSVGAGSNSWRQYRQIFAACARVRRTLDTPSSRPSSTLRAGLRSTQLTSPTIRPNGERNRLRACRSDRTHRPPGEGRSRSRASTESGSSRTGMASYTGSSADSGSSSRQILSTTPRNALGSPLNWGRWRQAMIAGPPMLAMATVAPGSRVASSGYTSWRQAVDHAGPAGS